MSVFICAASSYLALSSIFFTIFVAAFSFSDTLGFDGFSGSSSSS
jgi:hypothetical protein